MKVSTVCRRPAQELWSEAHRQDLTSSPQSMREDCLHSQALFIPHNQIRCSTGWGCKMRIWRWSRRRLYSTCTLNRLVCPTTVKCLKCLKCRQIVMEHTKPCYHGGEICKQNKHIVLRPPIRHWHKPPMRRLKVFPATMGHVRAV